MEILATNVSYVGFIVYTAVLFIVFITASFGIMKAKSRKETVVHAAIALLCVTGAVLGYFDERGVTTYDAIITDWNAVYEQGYDVVETNGKIVTLRKVGE